MRGDISRTFTNQQTLENVINKLFPAEEISTNSRKSSDLKDSTNWPLEIDLWLKPLNLCFEFQDSYHYTTTWYSQIPFSAIQEKDYIKQQLIRAKEETLIEVPFWWQGDRESLAATISFHRPDLLFGCIAPHSFPISLNPLPQDLEASFIPTIGSLMLASFPPHFVNLQQSIGNHNPWWFGEKYDGIRFCWHPSNKQLYTRRGYELDVPSCFSDHFSNVYSDGEIWFGYNRFSKAQQVVLSDASLIEWGFLRGIVFDTPDPLMQYWPFEARFEYVLAHTDYHHPFLVVASRTFCTSKELLLFAIKNIIHHKGEGIIMRKPASPYIYGRSLLLYKLKASMTDIEGLIVNVQTRFTLTIQLPNGSFFTGEIQKTKLRLKAGDIVVLAHLRNSKQLIHTHPKILRVRKDITWEEVLQNWRQNIYRLDYAIPSQKALHVPSITLSANHKLKTQLISFAQKHSFDPFVLQNWLFCTTCTLLIQECKKIIVQCGGVSKLLQVLFPDISPQDLLYLKKFRKLFFINYAEANEFDYLVSDNWYQITMQQILSVQYGDVVLSYHDNKLDVSLLTLFPDIGLQKSRFVYLNYSDNKATSRQLLIDFANSHNFDYTHASNWYQQRLQAIGSIMKPALLKFHNGSVGKALIDVFPEIGLQLQKFNFFAMNFWNNKDNQRDFFIDFAKKYNFNPLVPNNWYSVTTKQIRSQKSSGSVLHYYNGNFKTALLSTFPDIGLEVHQFSTRGSSLRSKKDI